MSLPLVPADEAGVDRAVTALDAGRLILHPTETVVSLTGDARLESAVAAARRLKGYERPRPFLCLVPDAAAARSLCGEWPPAARRLADALWPGPLTLVLVAAPDAPAPVVSEGTIALRPASDPISAAVVRAWGGPLFSTSANPKGGVPPVHVAEAARALASAPGAEALALGLLEPAAGPRTPSAAGEPSTIVDVAGVRPRLVREGAISADRLRSTIPDLEAPEQ